MMKCSSLITTLLAVMLGSSVPGQAGSQQVEVRLFGRVLDAGTGRPVVGASVVVSNARGAVLADTAGTFVVETQEAEDYLLTVSQLGYRTAIVTLPESAPREFTTLMLEPKPLELEGLRVLVDRFERRRRTYDGAVRVLDQSRLAQMSTLTAWDLVRAQVPGADQCNDNAMAVCAPFRGELLRVSVCLDEEQAWGGVADLARFQASDLYMVEVLDRRGEARGREVRIYTRTFMDELMESGRNLTPLQWRCG